MEISILVKEVTSILVKVVILVSLKAEISILVKERILTCQQKKLNWMTKTPMMKINPMTNQRKEVLTSHGQRLLEPELENLKKS